MKSILIISKNPFKKAYSNFRGYSTKKKVLLILGIVIGLVVINVIISSATKPDPFTIESVKRSNITEVVTESGNIVTSGRHDVYSPSNGVVSETYVENGMQVNEGDVLFVVKSSASDQEEDAAHANYLSALSSLNSAQAASNTLRASMYAEWKLFRDLATNSTYEKGDDSPDIENRKAAEFQIAQDEWLAAEKKFKDQETAIAQANAAVASTKALYLATQDATVVAPVSGTVANLGFTKGSTVSIESISALGSVSQPALMIISDFENEILIELSETDVAKVKPNQRVDLSINAIPNKKFKGKVSRVDSIGTNTQGVISYKAFITLDDNNSDIRQGMTVDAEITTKELKNVLSVPNSAVKPYQGGRAVRVPDSKMPEKFRYVPVVIGVRGVNNTQIIEGLEEGQEVITTLSNENIKRPGLFGS